jgi:hypothetical protein
MKRSHLSFAPIGGGRKDGCRRPVRIAFRFAAPGQVHLRNPAVGKFEQDVILIMAPRDSHNG